MNHKLKNMNKVYFIAVIFISTLFLLPPGAVLSQQEERLAVVSEYEGDVKVEHELIKKTVTRIGNRIRNSAVYEEDSVMTMHDSTADLVFNDNTSLEIDEDTSLTISSREMSGEEKAEGGFIRQVSGKQSGIVRNIHVKAGKFLANITPSKSVLTEFETPTGVASVRGTAFTLAYVAGVTSIDLTQGLIDFADAGQDVSFSVEPGDNIDISLSEHGHSSIGVNSGQLDVETETGTLIIESGESTHVDVDDDTGEIHVTADEGTVDFETSTGMAVIEEGEIAGTSVDADTGEVTISSEEGSVTFETETGIATIEEGASATTSKDCADTCSISLGAEDGTVEFETASGKVVIEDGEAAGTKVDQETGKVSVSSEVGMIGFESHMGNVMMEEGNIIGALVDATTGEVIMTAEVGAMEFDTAMGRAMMEEGDVVGALIDAETGNVIMTAEVGMVEFETTMGRVMMDEGDAMGAHIDADTGEMFMSAEQGDITFETSAGTASLEHGEIVGTAFDQDTGQVTMTAMEGEVSFDTPMGMAVMQEGAVMEVTFDDNTGEVSMSSGGGSYTLETDNGIITMEDGGSMEFSVDHNTGEITVTGVIGDVVMTNEDGTTMTIESGTSLGIMQDDGHDGPMDGDGYDGPMDGDGHDGPDGHDGEGPEDGTFEGNVTETDGGLVYEGTMTDAFGMWSGSYNEGTDQFIGTLQLNDGNLFTFNADGSVTDQYGNTLNNQQIQQLMSQTGGDPNDPNNPNNTSDPNNTNGPVTPTLHQFNVSNIFGTPVNSVDMTAPAGIDINYQSGTNNMDATFKSTGPGLVYVQNESIEGNSDGILTLLFSTPTPLINFGSALNVNSGVTNGFTVRLFDVSNTLFRTFNIDTSMSSGWSEGMFNHVGSLVKKVEIDYKESAASRFVFDNLFYTRDDKFFDDFQGSSNIGSWWNQQLNASTSTSFGSINAKSGNTGDRFAVIHTGGASGPGATMGKLGIKFDFAETATRHLSFDYNFVTTETGGNDTFTVKLIMPGQTETLVSFTSSATGMTSVSGLSGAGLDTDSGSQTGWLTYDGTWNIPAGITELVFEVNDVGVNTNDSAVLIDSVLDPIVEPSSTDYLLTFARMLRGDIDVHDADLAADAVASAEHQAFIAKVNEVIADIENISDSEFAAGRDEFFGRLWVARDTLANHEDTTEFLQQTGVAHHLLEASVMATEGVSTNITAIKDSINQAKGFLVAHINDFGETDALANIKTNIDSVLANIDNVNNNEFTTATMVAIRDGIKQAFSDTIDHMSSDGHECITGNHIECNQS